MCFVPPGLAAEKVVAFVSIMPQEYFVQQVGGDLVEVHVMVEPGASPHTYEPKPRQMAQLSRARAYFAVGVEFEKAWLDRIARVNPNLKVVHTEQGIDKIPMAEHHRDEGEPHDSGEGHDEVHDHGGLDPHIWLSPPLAKVQARAIAEALQAIDPANRAAYEANFNEFAARVDALDADLRAIFTARPGTRFMVFHPAWGYFARAYGIEQVPVEIEGKNPKPAQLQALIAHAREEGIKVIFAQPQFSTRSAEVIAREIGGQVVFADPLAGDWMANLREVASRFAAALR